MRATVTQQVPDCPIPSGSGFNRWLIQVLASLARRQVLSISGLEHIAARQDPFIVVLNHSTRLEALWVPALLMLHRDNRLIHFYADWNYRLLPIIGLIYRRAQTVTVTRKAAKPRFLNVFKPLYMRGPGALRAGLNLLAAGEPLGIFPEGTVNRDPAQLKPGHKGAAYLSLRSGAAIVPAGIRFPDASGQIRDTAAMEVVIGAPMKPPRLARHIRSADIDAWHEAIMKEIGRLSGKAWIGPATASEAKLQTRGAARCR